MRPGAFRLLGTRAIAEYQTGNFDEGWDFLERYLEAFHQTTVKPSLEAVFASEAIPIIGRITSNDEWIGMVEASMRTALATPFNSTFHAPFVEVRAWASLALLAVRSRNITICQECKPELEKHLDGRFVFAVGMSLEHIVGLLDHALGNGQEEMTHF